MPAAPSASSLAHLKFRHLMLVDALAQLGTLHKAAKQLNFSQPAATAMLNDLENILGLSLFTRSHQGTVPTAQGRQVIDSMRTMLNEFNSFASTIERIAQGEERVIRMGAVPQAFTTYLPGAIELFRREGGCAIQAQEGTARQLVAQLWHGHLDCVIGRLPGSGMSEEINTAALHFETLYREEICVVRGLPGQANRAEGSYEWLKKQAWVLQRRDSSVRHALNEAFLRNGVQPPEPAVETTNYIQSLALVAKTGFYTVAPRRAAAIQQTLGAVYIVDIDLQIEPMQVSFITRQTSGGSAQLRLFKDCFMRAVALVESSG